MSVIIRLRRPSEHRRGGDKLRTLWCKKWRRSAPPLPTQPSPAPHPQSYTHTYTHTHTSHHSHSYPQLLHLFFILPSTLLRVSSSSLSYPQCHPTSTAHHPLCPRLGEDMVVGGVGRWTGESWECAWWWA
jgi:hypothetical protein